MGSERSKKDSSVPRSAFSIQRSEAALVLFAKAPIPGQVKTRLCPPLTPDEAAGLHGSFVLDALEQSRRAAKLARGKSAQGSLDRFVACAPSPAHVFFKILEEREGVRLIHQIGDDLGARMEQAFKALFAMDYQRVLLVGTDLPTLPASVYMQALSLLSDHDLVLGPSLDGGYYLIGLKRPAPDLFAGMPWSTDRVLALTQKKADTLGLKTALLPPCRDVDTIDDLLALIHEAGLEARGTRQGGKTLARSPSPLVPSLSVRTAGVLRLLAGRLSSRSSPGQTGMVGSKH